MTEAVATPTEAIRQTAQLLPSLHTAALDLMLARKSSPVAVYLSLLADAQNFDLRTDTALAFRTRFNGYYGVRRNATWRAGFYDNFEQMKSVGGSAERLFEGALWAIHGATGRVEASFVSKAVATLRPESPVIDKILRDRFASLVAAPPFGGGLDEAVTYYRWLAAVMIGLAATPEAIAWFAVYDDAFAKVAGAASVHPIKKLDFLLWGGRLVAV